MSLPVQILPHIAMRAYEQNDTAEEILSIYTRRVPREPRKAEKEETVEDPIAEKQEIAVVYDITAEPSCAISRPRKDRRLLESASPNDLRAYNRMEQVTPFPVYPSNRVSERLPSASLAFESRFESGNISKAVKINDWHYELYISPDTNTNTNNQWFYFAVKNPRKRTVVFSIVNRVKPDDLYLNGMKPAVFSSKLHKYSKKGWHRTEEPVSYENKKLSFTYTFVYSRDTVYFAYSIPYTYTQLMEHLRAIPESDFCRLDTLCQTLGGNDCPFLTITSEVSTYKSFEEESHEWGVSATGRRILRMRKKKKLSNHAHKKAVVITARVHSGETVSSYMMDGFLQFLLSEGREAKLLRKHFVFKIIPMLNPDGVVYGNYRCSLLGVDLNRRWKTPNKVLHPTVYYAKKMIEVLKEEHEIMMFCDLHGHTRKRNVFMYGCSTKVIETIDLKRNLLAKVVPVLLQYKNPFFSFKDSNFGIHYSKESTGRVVVFREFDVSHSYTMEASFYGPSSSNAFGESYDGDLHLKPFHLKTLGIDLCKICLTFISSQIYTRRVIFTNNHIRKLVFGEKPKPVKEFNKHVKNELCVMAEKDVCKNLKVEIKEDESYKKNVLDYECWKKMEVTSHNNDKDDSGSDSDLSKDEHLNIKEQVLKEHKEKEEKEREDDNHERAIPKFSSKRKSKLLFKLTEESSLRNPKQHYIERKTIPVSPLSMIDFFKSNEETKNTKKLAMNAKNNPGSIKTSLPRMKNPLFPAL